MKITVNIKNDSLCFENKEIELTKKGLYWIFGKNGAGKTSIIKDIVFKSRFDDENCNHFSYAEQEPQKYDIRIYDYITRFNRNILKENVTEYIKYFGLEYLSLEDSIVKLSGGEIGLLNIIACLCKDTDFVFLDEPANNLDDEHVEALQRIMLSLAKDKIVVFASHDPRLVFENYNKIVLEHNDIIVEYADAEDGFPLAMNGEAIAYPVLNMVKRHSLRPITILTYILVLLMMVFIGVTNWVAYKEFYWAGGEYETRDSILILPICFEDLNEAYCKSHGIVISRENSNSAIMYKDLRGILQNVDVDYIYMVNEKYIDKVSEDWTYGRNIVEISLPDECMPFAVSINSLFSNDELIEGRFPSEGKREIVIPGNTDDDAFSEKEIGDLVRYKDRDYTVVGLHKGKFCIPSYDEKCEYVVRLTKDNIDEYVDSMQKFYDEKNESDYSFAFTMVVKTETGKERAVLNDLIMLFPQNGYDSRCFGTDVARYNNRSFFIVLSIVDFCIVSLFVVFLNRASKRRRLLLKEEITSFDNYYLCKNKTLVLFRNVELVTTALTFLISTGAILIIAGNTAEIVMFVMAALVFSLAYSLGLVKNYAA